MREYSALNHVPVAPRARLARPEGSGRVTLDDPTLAVMTDLREVPAATTSAGESVDLMTPASQLEALSLQDVSQMRVGHIVATLKQVRRQHVMVCEDGGRVVRGLFSASKVARQLGVQLQTFEVAGTFADIEAALART